MYNTKKIHDQWVRILIDYAKQFNMDNFKREKYNLDCVYVYVDAHVSYKEIVCTHKYIFKRAQQQPLVSYET